MAILTLHSNSYSLNTLHDEILYTFTRLKAEGSMTALTATFESLLGECKKAQETEVGLHEKIIMAEAMVDTCDDRLDRGIDALSSTILKISQGDRSHALYQRYFGLVRPSELKKPILGEELDTVRKWIDSLKSSLYKEVQEVGATLEKVVKEADLAVKEVNSAREQMADFRTTGIRALLFEKVNAARKSTYGELSKRSHDISDKKSSDFANQFFMRVRSKKRPDPVTANQFKLRIEELQQDLKLVQEQYDMLQAQEENKAKLEADYEAELKRLSETEKAHEASAKRAAELKEKLGKK